ncbi:hypothetical protein B0J11DRAFT_31789 [Dendryphion nanum]|uniref:Uncharacterized protein n=1 Tax=Dendryphion nanum TaxID=256645 RepID=A0A9P9EKX3_9PLEO|nr:hypothetical protein B0J11DRAFT_31789 [Dendryphion nanum]
MVRIPRRTHSVSGPPAVQFMLKDVACCCNMVKIHQFHNSMMALRRNPQRRCQAARNSIRESLSEPSESGLTPRHIHRQPVSPSPTDCTPENPFPFFNLPREVRDHVYSYLVVHRGKRTPIIEAKPIIRGQKKRATAQRTRQRLNFRRSQNGRRPITPREPVAEPTVHLNVLRVSRSMNYEASDYLYKNNWFAISIDNFPITNLETPYGWNFQQIKKLQVELQLKDAQRMNSYVDWRTFFAAFSSLRFLRIVPTFHSRYFEWAEAELRDWNSAHFIFRAFFRELLASIPDSVQYKLGPSLDPSDDMQLEGKTPVSTHLLQDMYIELGSSGIEGHYLEARQLAASRVVDIGGVAYQQCEKSCAFAL